MQKRKGITLIVLVITIIVIIILSGAVILGLVNTNIFNNANKDKYIEEVTAYKNSLELYHSNNSIKSPNEYKMENINASGEEMKKYITEMQEKDYNKFKIKKGELVYIGENSNEIEWSSGVIPVEALSFKLTDNVNGKEINITLELSGKIAKIGKNKEVEVFLTEHKRGVVEDNLKEENLFSTSEKGTITESGDKISKSFTFSNLEYGVVYLVTAIAKVDGKEYKTSESEIIYTALGSEFNEPGNIDIKWRKTNTKDEPIADVTLADTESGINKSACKFIFDSNSSNYGIDDPIWKDRYRTTNFSKLPETNGKYEIVLAKPSRNGKYYLHVLSVDKFNNKKSAVSDPLIFDTNPPDISNLKAILTPDSWTKSASVVINGISSDIYELQYLLPGENNLTDNKNWNVYNGSFKIYKNGVIAIRALDKAGNISNTKEILNVTNIDFLAPLDKDKKFIFSPVSANNVKEVKVTVSVEDAEGTNESGKSGIKVKKDGGIKYLWSNSNKLLDANDGQWVNASTIENGESVTKSKITQITYLHIRAEDNAGNVRTYVSDAYNIDNTAPNINNINVKLMPNGYTNQDVTAIINGISSDAVIRKYTSPDNANWQDCNNGTQFTVTKNGVINIKVIDAAGNEDTKTISIDKIDKLVPSVTVTPSSKTTASKSVSVKISAKDAEKTNEYCKSDIESIKYQWKTTNTKLNVSDLGWQNVNNNSTVTINNVTGDRYLHVLVKDRAGNIVNYVSGKYVIDNTPPDISKLRILLSPKTYTKEATASIVDGPSDDSIIEYTLPGSNQWIKYERPFKVTRNGKIAVRAKDSLGNMTTGIKELNVTNIDKLAPSNIILSPSSANNVREIIVNVKATDATATSEDASSGIDVIKYQWRQDSNLLDVNNSSWNNVNSTIANNGNITLNGLTGTRYLHVLAIDKAGNKKSVVSKAYTLDNTAPSMENIRITINPTSYTRQATVTITGKTSDMNVLEYTLPGENNFHNYVSPFEVTKNGVIRVRSVDKLGNISVEKTLNVTNIDRVAPTAPRITNTSNERVTRSKVTITLTSNDNLSGVSRYEWKDGNSWVTRSLTMSNGVGTITFDAEMNKSISFRAIDNVGNISSTSSTIVNIDRTAPDVTKIQTTLSTGTRYTNTNPTVTLTGFPADAYRKQYSTDGRNWYTYSSPFTISSNCTIYAKAIDEAGNEASNSGYKVTTIDKTPPSLTNFGYTRTTNSISISNITCSDNIGIQYYRFTTNTGLDSQKTTSNRYTFNNLSTGSTYTVQVTVYDYAGNTRSFAKNITTKSIYRIVYYPNGGRGEPADQTQVEGDSLRLSSQTPTRTNYNFVEWNTRSDGYGTSYYPGSTYTFTNSTDLYAIWKENSKPITDVTAGDYVDIGLRGDWVILYDSTDGRFGIQAISVDGVSSYTLRGRRDYVNLRSDLNYEASRYCNSSNLVTDARCVGTIPDYPTYNDVISESSIDDYAYSNSHGNNEILQYDDFRDDVRRMKSIGVYDTPNGNYFLACRGASCLQDGTSNTQNWTYEYDAVIVDGRREDLRALFDLGRNGGNSYTVNALLRPCCTLDSSLKITGGAGTRYDPYILGY